MPHPAPALRPSSGVLSEDAWRRASFVDAALEPGGVVLLAWDDEPAPETSAEAAAAPAGLAFDPWCRLYRSRPEAGTVERVRWAAGDPLTPLAPFETFDLFMPPATDAADAANAADDGAEFGPSAPAEGSPDGAPGGPLARPFGVAIDDRGRLFVAEQGNAADPDSGRVLVFDLERRRLLRAVRFPADPGFSRPGDLATDGERVFALLRDRDGASGLAVFDAQREATRLALPPLPGAASRVAIGPGGALALITDAGTADARVVSLGRARSLPAALEPEDSFAVARASDLVFTADGTLVVARAAGDSFARFRLRRGASGAGFDRLAPLEARGYDGRGIARTPDDRIVFWTARGPRHAVPARRRYRRRGRVITFRLDAGAFQTQWGRLFLDACIPRGTEVRVRCVAFDEPPDAPAMAHLPPVNSGGAPPPHAELTPPLPPALLRLDDADATPAEQRLHRRATAVGGSRELPWSSTAGGPGSSLGEPSFVTYEAPVQAQPGRYLWLAIELRGDGRSTPRVRRLRVERPGHDLLRRLPRAFSREDVAADFLRRYLATFEGFLADLDNRAACRHALLDPHAVPAAMLPWLASFVGLVLDERWPEAARRTAIAEAVWLFRFRGTIAGLRRLLEIYLGRAVIIVEHYRLRGLGGAIVGGELADDADALRSRAVLGAGFRVGGAVAGPGDDIDDLEAEVDALRHQPAADGFATHAHRFTVVVPVALDAEQRSVVDHILEQHRPAHTLVQVCSVETSMRIGVGLYVALTTLIGATGGFGRLRLGASTLGRQALLADATNGAGAGSAGSARLGHDTRIG